MGLSLLAVPVLLDTDTKPSHLLAQFVQLYQYGHRTMPALAVATCLLYGYIARRKRATSRSWLIHAVAGVATITMVPFTWLVMLPTNNTLFRLNEEKETSLTASGDLVQVQELVLRWSRLHLIRSLFPLAGAIVGFKGLLQDVKLG